MHRTFNFLLLLLVLLHITLEAIADSPWYLKDIAVSSPLYRQGDITLDATGNSSHLYVLDQWFYIHLFKFIGASGTVVYSDFTDHTDNDGIIYNWDENRTTVDVKIGLNQYNTQFYMLKYAVDYMNYIIIYRFNSYDLLNAINSYTYRGGAYLEPNYPNPRLKLEFDATSVYICQYNNPLQTPETTGYFIMKLTHSLQPIANITSTLGGALSIKFFCHQSPLICVWTTNQTVIEYWMSDLTVYRNYSAVPSPVTMGINPKIVETNDGNYTYYLHAKVDDNKAVVLHKKNSNHTAVADEVAQLPYNVSFPPPEAYDMVISNNGYIIAGLMTAPIPSIGFGQRDIAAFRYSPTLQLESKFILSTVLQDNITRIFLPSGEENVVTVCGSTDGSPDSPFSTTKVRKAFVARFEYFQISSVSTTFPSYVMPGENVNISFSTVPPLATTGIPIVQFNQQNCSAVKWTGNVLSATMPSAGSLGEPADLGVQFHYLAQSPSVTAKNISYIMKPILMDVQPKKGPATGYNITLTTANLFLDDNKVSAFVGVHLCENLGHVNATTLTCWAPPGTGSNIPVVLSNGNCVNSTEQIYVAYDAPIISQISPRTVPTEGGAIVIQGSNFGPCSTSPCVFTNIIITVGSFGLCSNGVHFNDTALQCTVPEGFNTTITVNVNVSGQSDTGMISYGKPEITSISPSTSTSKNPTVYLEGSNFGGFSASRAVVFQDVSSLQNYTCPNVTWVSHQNIRCVFAGVDLPLPATLNITLTVGNQFSEFSTNSVFRSGVSNNPPTSYPLNNSIFEEQPVILQFEGYDTDVDDFVTMYITKTPANGSLFQLTYNGDKGLIIDTVFGPIPVTDSLFRVLYVPDNDFNGNDSFLFKARDVYNADSSTQTAAINVIPVPDPPIPKPHTYQTDEDTEISFTLDVIDPDSASFDETVIVLSLPKKGTLLYCAPSNLTIWNSITTIPLVLSQNTTFKYQPLQNIYGIDSFDFMANDGHLNSTTNSTISLLVNPVNDLPIFNTSRLNMTVYEDTEAQFEFDVSDIDITDKLTVKITNLRINGSIYFIDLEKGGKSLLGEGSEVKGPPYKVLYVPAHDFFSATLDDYQHFNVTYTDGVMSEHLFYQVSFPVLSVNDPPRITCTPSQIELPVDFLVGVSRNYTFQFQVSDVDDTNLTFALSSTPSRGSLKNSSGQKLLQGQSFFDNRLIFSGERTGGGYPYSSFTIYATDSHNMTSEPCTFLFTVSCPPGLYNNIFSNGTGEVCETCPQGAVCSVDGKIAPRPQAGWWRSEDNSTFLACFPIKACTGTAENSCGTGYRGLRCAECEHTYYRFGDACLECSTINYIPSIIAVFVLGSIVAFIYFIRKMKIYRSSFALMNILINFLQTIWMLRKVRLDWPLELLAIIDYINFLNFNVELVSPECLIQSSLNFSQKARIVLALPIVLLILVVLMLATSVFFKFIKKLLHLGSETCKKTHPAELYSSEKYGEIGSRLFPRLIKLFNIALSILYVNLASKSLSLFDCTYESDGKAYLDDEVSLVCYTDWWYQDLPLNLAAVMLYTIGIPVYFGVLSYLYCQTRHHGSTWERWRRISKEILHCDGDFKPEHQYFVVVQLLHKLAIVSISVFFSRYTGLQLVLTIVSLQIILIAYNKYNPYLHQTLNTLEKISVMCSMLVLALGLPFRVDTFQLAQYRVGLIIVILSVIFGFIVLVIGAALRDILHSLRSTLKARRLTERNVQS